MLAVKCAVVASEIVHVSESWRKLWHDIAPALLVVA